jgi:hypothetical protein
MAIAITMEVAFKAKAEAGAHRPWREAEGGGEVS